MLLNLQLLRAFAALNVVLFHTIGTAVSYGYETDFISYLEGWGQMASIFSLSSLVL